MASSTSLVFNVLAKDKASKVFDQIKDHAKVAMAAVGAAAVTYGAVSINAASDLAETQSKVAVIFGKSSREVEAFASQAAAALGQSKQAALDGAATFALYGKAAGKSGQELVTFSTDMVKLASDMASFSNTSPEEAIGAIGAALRGESDPIEKYGVLLNEATIQAQALKMGLIKTKSEALTPANKVLAVQAAILAQTGDAQGDFARTSDGLANRQRVMKAELANVTAEIGTQLLPVAQKLSGWALGAINWMKAHSAIMKPLVAILGGLAVVIGTVVAIVKVYTAVQWLLNAAMTANPIGLIIIAVMALIAGIVLLWKNSETFRNIVLGVWHAIATAATWLWNTILKPIFNGLVLLWKNVVAPAAMWLWNNVLKPAWDGIVTGVKWVWNWVQKSFLGWKLVFAKVAGFVSGWWTATRTRFMTAVDFFKSLPGRIAKGLASLRDKLLAPFKAAFNAVAGLWNRTLGKLSFTVPGWVPGIGGKGWSMPKLPMLAKGGNITRAGMAVVGDGGEPEVVNLPRGASVTPLSRAAAPSGGTQVLQVVSDGSRLGDLLAEMIRETVRVKGRGNVQVAFGRR